MLILYVVTVVHDIWSGVNVIQGQQYTKLSTSQAENSQSWQSTILLCSQEVITKRSVNFGIDVCHKR